MIDLKDGLISQHWPNPDAVIKSYAYAVHKAVDRLIRTYMRRSTVYSDLDGIPESVLDLLAIELRTQYYDDTLPVETKRGLIKGTLLWYTKAGTFSAVTELLSVVFGEGDLEEWFYYDGDPYHFRAVLPVSLKPPVSDMNLFRELIQKIKNARSHMDEIVLEEKTVLKLRTSARTFRVCPPRCGTIPMVSTGFSQDNANLVLQTGEFAGRAKIPMVADAHAAGTQPSASTGFSQDNANVALQTGEIAGRTRIPMAADAHAAGTQPSASTGFTQDATDLALQTADMDGVSRMPHTGTPKTNQEGGLIK